jgi:hypothetical protein
MKVQVEEIDETSLSLILNFPSPHHLSLSPFYSFWQYVNILENTFLLFNPSLAVCLFCCHGGHWHHHFASKHESE